MQLVNECFNIVKKDYFKFLNKEKISVKSKAEKIKNLKNTYIPMSFWIENKYKKKGDTLFLGFSGGQGSGKTTAVKILKIILKKFFKRKVHVSSIDDFYKTLKDRNRMSQNIHPLFKTRGVPGTHDINLVKKFFDFVKAKRFKKTKLPKFDKSIDDRSKKKYWFKIKEKPEIVILEGWCVGAKPQSNFLIKKPVNLLEKYEDQDLTWRYYVNAKLKEEYKKISSAEFEARCSTHPHNIYFEFLAETGILIFIPFVLFNLILTYKLIFIWFSQKKFDDLNLLIFCSFTILFFTVSI